MAVSQSLGQQLVYLFLKWMEEWFIICPSLSISSTWTTLCTKTITTKEAIISLGQHFSTLALLPFLRGEEGCPVHGRMFSLYSLDASSNPTLAPQLWQPKMSLVLPMSPVGKAFSTWESLLSACRELPNCWQTQGPVRFSILLTMLKQQPGKTLLPAHSEVSASDRPAVRAVGGTTGQWKSGRCLERKWGLRCGPRPCLYSTGGTTLRPRCGWSWFLTISSHKGIKESICCTVAGEPSVAIWLGIWLGAPAPAPNYEWAWDSLTSPHRVQRALQKTGSAVHS